MKCRQLKEKQQSQKLSDNNVGFPYLEKNVITVFDFHVGHDIPESKGGTLDINNLKPICARCNLSMSDTYTIQEWIELTQPKKKFFSCIFP